MRSRTIIGVVAVFLLMAGTGASAHARAYVPPGGHIFAGLSGGSSITAFQKLVGKHPPVFETFMTWSSPTGWLARADRSFRSRLALHIGTAPGYGRPGVISPRQIAQGRSDRFLVALNRNLAHSGRIVYIRLMAEMNGYWNAYAAFNRTGSSRGPQNSPHAFIAAWRRSVLILRGGSILRIDRRLSRIHQPRLKHVRRSTRSLPRPRVAFLWVPQDAGSPDTPANSPAAFWPGRAYVDWVGTDFYASYPNFTLLNRFYNRFGGKPFVLSEWALYGSDDPAFVRSLFTWVRHHRRVRMLNYYQGFGAGSPANLVQYPRSRAALRQELRSKLFAAYAPEYAHPLKRHRHKKPRPPLPPIVGNPPTPPGPPPGQLCLPVVNLCVPAL